MTNIVQSSTTPLTIVELTSSVHVNTDLSVGNGIYNLTLKMDGTLENPTNIMEGTTYIWFVNQDATGGWALAFGSVFLWPAGTPPTITTSAGATDIITGAARGGFIYVVASQDFS